MCATTVISFPYRSFCLLAAASATQGDSTSIFFGFRCRVITFLLSWHLWYPKFAFKLAVRLDSVRIGVASGSLFSPDCTEWLRLAHPQFHLASAYQQAYCSAYVLIMVYFWDSKMAKNVSDPDGKRKIRKRSYARAVNIWNKKYCTIGIISR